MDLLELLLLASFYSFIKRYCSINSAGVENYPGVGVLSVIVSEISDLDFQRELTVVV